MDKVYLCLDDLLLSLDNSSLIKEFKKAKDDVYSNSKLVDSLNEFHNLEDDKYKMISLKRKIITDDLFLNYIYKQRALNYLIRVINDKIGELINEEGNKKCVL